MALWQYTFIVLPRKSIETFPPGFSFTKDEDGFDDAPFWVEQSIKCDFFKDIDSILPIGKSWSKDINLYGNQESNCFEVLFENGLVLSVSFRIDFTSHYDDVLNALIEFCIFKGLLILDENLKITPLNFEVIKHLIENSPQVKKYKTLSNQ
jgi:hypothetical protein